MRDPIPSQSLGRLTQPKNQRSHGGGFTLVEIMVVLGIIIMILGFTAPAVVGILRGKKVEQALSAVSDVLERARIEAITQNTYLWVGFVNIDLVSSGNGQDEL